MVLYLSSQRYGLDLKAERNQDCIKTSYARVAELADAHV